MKWIGNADKGRALNMVLDIVFMHASMRGACQRQKGLLGISHC